MGYYICCCCGDIRFIEAKEGETVYCEGCGGYMNKEDYDPTPYCSKCKSRTKEGCDCGPILKDD